MTKYRTCGKCILKSLYWKNRKSNVEQAAQIQDALEPWQRITEVLGKEVPNFRAEVPQNVTFYKCRHIVFTFLCKKNARWLSSTEQVVRHKFYVCTYKMIQLWVTLFPKPGNSVFLMSAVAYLRHVLMVLASRTLKCVYHQLTTHPKLPRTLNAAYRSTPDPVSCDSE